MFVGFFFFVFFFKVFVLFCKLAKNGSDPRRVRQRLAPSVTVTTHGREVTRECARWTRPKPVMRDEGVTDAVTVPEVNGLSNVSKLLNRR